MTAKGMIFNIQKFSIHDGPGIRTTVFLKGCPLRCAWCANPESQQTRTEILYDRSKCLHCGSCSVSCPRAAIRLQDQTGIFIDSSFCDGCGVCVTNCPGQALTSEGRLMTAREVFAICMQDLDFYQESGGGVTISGGEGLCQPVFVEQLLTLLKEAGVHTAIETTGHVGEDIFSRLAPCFDLLLFDVKHADSVRHRQGTGVGNDLILKNLVWARSKNLPILPRIPVIPGFNADEEDARALALLLKEMDFNQVQLLPFHQMGERKYEFLNRDYKMKNQKALHPEDLGSYRQIFIDQGIEAFF